MTYPAHLDFRRQYPISKDDCENNMVYCQQLAADLHTAASTIAPGPMQDALFEESLNEMELCTRFTALFCHHIGSVI